MKEHTLSKNRYLSTPDRNKRIFVIAGVCLIVIVLILCIVLGRSQKSTPNQQSKSSYEQEELPVITTEPEAPAKPISYKVESVIDGDTIKINYNGSLTSVRLIGVNTPETVDSRTTVECFGKEASNYLKSKLAGKQVTIEADPSQTDRDIYDRLLRYVYLDNEDVGLSIIVDGYGYEYTYNVPYQKQSEYKSAQNTASANKRGLWSDSTCSGKKENGSIQPEPETPKANCVIKGNISSKGEKIYHMPGQKYYDATKIDTSKGERYFCTEQEAINAGWRKAKV